MEKNISVIKRLKQIIEKLNNLPTLPAVATEVIRLAQDPASSIKQISYIMKNDQTLTAKVLKLANSAFYGISGGVTTIERAISLLGLNTISNIALSITAFDTIGKFSDDLLLTKEYFWKHSISCGIAARMISQNFNYPDPNELFTAGLLHDIGKIIMLTRIYEDYIKVLSVSFSDRISHYKSEYMTIGITHDLVGSQLARNWNLPDNLREAIQYHHKLSPGAENPLIASIIHLADIICHMELDTPDETMFKPEMDSQIKEVLKNARPIFHESEIDIFASHLREQMREAGKILAIIGS